MPGLQVILGSPSVKTSERHLVIRVRATIVQQRKDKGDHVIHGLPCTIAKISRLTGGELKHLVTFEHAWRASPVRSLLRSACEGEKCTLLAERQPHTITKITRLT